MRPFHHAPARLALLAGLAAFGALGTAHAAVFETVVPEKSAITFGFKQIGVPVEGRFGKFNAKIHFDPAKPEQASAALSIETESIDVSSAEANAEVVGPKWFDVKKFPAATFTAQKVTAKSPTSFDVSGKLAIKGVVKDVVAKADFKPDASGVGGVFSGVLPIQRSTFHIGEGEWADTSVVADEVQIKFRLAVTGKK